MASYSPNNIKTTWTSIIIQGPMDGQFFSAVHNKDDTELHVGADGFATYVDSSDFTGKIVVTLSQQSPTNALLSAALRNRVSGTFLMKDLSDVLTLVEGQEARIAKHAEIKRGDKILGLEWTFLCKKLILQAGGDQ